MAQVVQAEAGVPAAAGTPADRPASRRGYRRYSSRITYVLARLGLLVPGAFVAATATFFIINLIPSDPIGHLLGDFASPEQIAAKKAELGLDKGIFERYVSYVGGLLTGDFGASYRNGSAVLPEMLGRLTSSLVLTIPGFLLARYLGIRLGVMQATSRRSGAVRGVVTVLQAMPSFVAAIFGIVVFVAALQVLPPPAGQISISATRPARVTGAVVVDSLLAGQFDTFLNALYFMVLPVLILGLMLCVPFARITASTIRSNLDADFTIFGRANGLSRRRILRNARKSARSSIITVSGIVAAELVGGTVIIERIFAWNGMGNWALSAIVEKDLPQVQAFVIFVTIATMVVYLVADVLSVLMDPRMK